ncbi:hypothetical protein JYU34_000684 [Plutella xylostella]|uniref:G-protein coupled receptors family 1 profile domain-containing protein n=1 Tax=Plutella xylostella TaxID=51655 RepID=A0ABQ7R8A8_PLUXY|nr:hypothetical protein JYU34_000684 [Plutella xylostella]
MWLAVPRAPVRAAPPPRSPANMTDPANSTDPFRAENFTRTMFNISALDYFTESIVSAVNIYYTPILVILGTIGNLLSICVFYTSKLRTLSTSQYLTALAVSDTVFIIQLLPPWLNAVDATGLFHREYFCQVFVYVSYVSCSLSSWLVVAFTAERFVAVLHPLRRNLLCTVERARGAVLALTAAAAVLNLPVLRFATPLKNDCNIDVAYYDHAARFNIVDTAVSFTIPLAVIIVLNTWITVGVCRLERARQQLVRAGGRGRRGGRGARGPVPPPRSQHRVTRMLLIVSTVFVLFNLPAYTMRICAYAMDMVSR